jgi:hypothetical protein
VQANNWTGYDTSEVFWWTTTFPDPVPPDVLLDWQRVVLVAGERYGIVRVEEAGSIGYRYDRDGSFAEFVVDHPDRVPHDNDLWPQGFFLHNLDPAMSPSTRVASLLDYVDPAGALTRRWVSDLRPFGYEIGLPVHDAAPPIVLNGGYDPTPDSATDTRWISVGTTVDIWFPWNRPDLHPGRGRRLLDNRLLAGLNGARLNAFLADVRVGARRAGASWSCPPPGVAAPSADENGAMLDAPPPGPH